MDEFTYYCPHCNDEFNEDDCLQAGKSGLDLCGGEAVCPSCGYPNCTPVE